MQKRGQRSSLYIGFDDSNHNGKRKGEVIVAIFSEIYQDNLITHFPRERRNKEFNEIEFWLKKISKRDYRFTILTHLESKKGAYNLPLVAPYLVENYLKKREEINELHLHFDGELKKPWKEIAIKDFKKSNNLVIKNYTGENKTEVPIVLGYADRMANFIFRGKRGNLDELLQNPKFVPIEQEFLIE